MEHESARPVESLWTWREVAAFLRIGRNAVYEMAARGELPSLRLGASRVRFVPAEIRAWLERQRAPGVAVLPLSERLAKSASMRKGEDQ
jgi:excisionase family DNA binding protein